MKILALLACLTLASASRRQSLRVLMSLTRANFKDYVVRILVTSFISFFLPVAWLECVK